MDIQAAAKAKVGKRSTFIKTEQQGVYPDTTVWIKDFAYSYNEPMHNDYFWHQAYGDYPVVGVNWKQAKAFCAWRTLNKNTYIKSKKKGRNLINSFRLPTEAEWEYAAYALKGNLIPGDENISAGRTYSWSGNTVRYQKRDKYQGAILANFKKGSGDYMGIAGKLNDNAAGPGPVRAYLPNDFGLYNMSGNVGEWVMDVYRPTTSSALRDEENHDLNPFRGSKFTKMVKDEDGRPVEKDSMGRLRYEFYTKEELANRTNVRTNDATNYRDGDDFSEVIYETDVHTLISNKSRVYKGGSWADRAYWLSPGTRRFMDEDQTSRAIGFRCAMNRLGGATGNNAPDGNTFQVKSKRPVRK